MDQELETGQPATLIEPTVPEEVSSDLLEDPIDYPIENQAEMVTLIEEPAPMTTDVIDGNLQPELEIAVEAINDLLDLHSTIKAHGVSSHDMSGLVTIQKRLIDNNIALPKTSLEEFTGYYTPERSLLNQKVSLETVGKVILETIKAWLRKLIDMVMSGYRWAKGLKQKHVVLDAQLVKARDVLMNVRKLYIKMKTLNGVLGSEAAKTMAELADTMLLTSALDRNRVTLYGFSDDAAVKQVKALFGDACTTSKAIAAKITQLGALMGNQEIPSEDDLNTLNDVALVLTGTEEMLAISDDPDYLLTNLGSDFWDKVEKFRSVQVVDFDDMVKHYGSAADALARIRSIKIDDPQKAEFAQSVIDTITTAVGRLNNIINFFNRAAQAQVQAAKTYREYYSSAIEVLLLDFKSKSPSPDSVKEMKVLIAQLQALK
ncbi:hypothetical protein D3C81_466970 [compost metagenome]